MQLDSVCTFSKCAELSHSQMTLSNTMYRSRNTNFSIMNFSKCAVLSHTEMTLSYTIYRFSNTRFNAVNNTAFQFQRLPRRCFKFLSSLAQQNNFVIIELPGQCILTLHSTFNGLAFIAIPSYQCVSLPRRKCARNRFPVNFNSSVLVQLHNGTER